MRKKPLGIFMGTATVNFDENFLALSKCEDFLPCAPAQGKEGLGE